MNGCMNNSAVNYNPSATVDDASCIYLEKVNNICYAFQDVTLDKIKDRSFTLSYALEGDNWVFFHDYIPDYYFHTREKLHTIKNSRIYTHNNGPAGQYYSSTPASFFVDMVFRSEEEMTLNSISWITEVMDRLTKANEEFSTLTHVTIWNAWQNTGRIPLSQVFESLEQKNVRKTQSQWNFNDFRDLVSSRGATVVLDIFQNYAVNTSALDPNMPWYDKKLLEDQYFIVRLEFDNSADKIVVLHDADADVTRSTR
jgi:hypothetical protein